MDSSQIKKKYGDLVVISGQEFVDIENSWVSISPALDVITEGIPGGSYVVLTGPKKVGKTTLALHISKNAQKVGRKVFYFNIEGRLKQRDLLGVHGLSLEQDQFEVVRSYRDPETNESRILFAHEYLEIGEYYIHTIPGSVLIFDSISMLLSEEESTSEITKQHRAPGAKLMANFLKRMSNVVPVNDTIVICIQQIIANTSGFGASNVRSGGRKIGYAVDIDLEAIKVEKLNDSNGIPYAQNVTWKTGSTATIAPGQTVVSTLRYGIGIDEVSELIDISTNLGLLHNAGKSGWYTMIFMEDRQDKPENFKPKIQGKEKLYQYFIDNEEILEILRAEVEGMTQ
jgi:recombination protein RecA